MTSALLLLQHKSPWISSRPDCSRLTPRYAWLSALLSRSGDVMRLGFLAVTMAFAAHAGIAPASADAISDNLNVLRMSPPLAYYTPGTIARGNLDARTYRRTGEKLLKVNIVRCRATFDKDGFEQALEGASFTNHDGVSFGLSAGWASILNAAFNGSYVQGVTLSFTGTVYEYPEDKLIKIRRSCLGSANPKSDTSPYQFQIVRLAVGTFEYTISYTTSATANLKGDIAQKFAAELGVTGGVDRTGKVVVKNGAMAYPLWRSDW